MNGSNPERAKDSNMKLNYKGRKQIKKKEIQVILKYKKNKRYKGMNGGE